MMAWYSIQYTSAGTVAVDLRMRFLFYEAAVQSCAKEMTCYPPNITAYRKSFNKTPFAHFFNHAKTGKILNLLT